MQATLICLAHNLMVIPEQKLAREEGVRNTSEIKRKARRLAKKAETLAANNEALPML